MSYVRVAYSPTGTIMQRAEMKLGKGDWEITSLSIVMGSTVPAFNGIETGEGFVAFEVLDTDGITVLQTHHLMAGRCTRSWPIVMNGTKRVKGPGRLRSMIRHLTGSTAHTMTAIYRRVN